LLASRFSTADNMSMLFRAGLVALSTWIAFGANWPAFLGPNGDGTSPETGLLDRLPAAGLPEVFDRPIGTGYAAPSVRDGQLVVFHRESDEEAVECWEAKSAVRRWRHAYPSAYQDPYGYNNGPRCAPLITTNRVFTFGAEGRLTCLDLTTGKPVWHRDTAKDWKVPQAFFGVGSTPLLEGGRLFVMVGGQPNSGMVALDPETGKNLWENVGQTNWQGVTTLGWRAERPYEWTGAEKLASYASPVAATIHGQRHLLSLLRQGLVSLNPTNGAIRFSRWFQSFANDSVNAMNPVVSGDLILISSAYYRSGAVLLRVRPDGNSYDEVWRDPARHPLDPADRDPVSGRWKVPCLELHWSTPILHQGSLYAFSGRNEPDASLRCVELATGRLRWERDERWGKHSSEQPPVFGRGSFICADGKLIALGEGGLLGLFRLNADRCEELGRWQVPSLKHPCWAAPVLSDGILYLRSENRLVAVRLAK
jgi:outer membrane protein assembly factor BamB